jgi:hypothetical protein
MSRFVRPETTTIALSGGETLTIRRRLSAGEARARTERWTEQVEDPLTGGVKLVPRLTRAGLATITAYLLDWSLTDDAGHRVEIQGIAQAELEAIVDNLDGDAFAEIRLAIEAHEEALRAERDAQKKTDGPSASSPTSISPAAAVGAMSG